VITLEISVSSGDDAARAARLLSFLAADYDADSMTQGVSEVNVHLAEDITPQRRRRRRATVADVPSADGASADPVVAYNALTAATTQAPEADVIEKAAPAAPVEPAAPTAPAAAAPTTGAAPAATADLRTRDQLLTEVRAVTQQRGVLWLRGCLETYKAARLSDLTDDALRAALAPVVV